METNKQVRKTWRNRECIFVFIRKELVSFMIVGFVNGKQNNGAVFNMQEFVEKYFNKTLAGCFYRRRSLCNCTDFFTFAVLL